MSPSSPAVSIESHYLKMILNALRYFDILSFPKGYPNVTSLFVPKGYPNVTCLLCRKFTIM